MHNKKALGLTVFFMTLFSGGAAYAWAGCAKTIVTIVNNSSVTWDYDSATFESGGVPTSGYSFESTPSSVSPGHTGIFVLQGSYNDQMQAYVTYTSTIASNTEKVVFYIERDERQSGHYHIPASADVSDGRPFAQELDVRHAYCDDPNKTSDSSYSAQAYFQFLDPATKQVTLNLAFKSVGQQELATKNALSGISGTYLSALDIKDYSTNMVSVNADDPTKASYVFEFEKEYPSVDTSDG